jgi:hypothetical protein
VLFIYFAPSRYKEAMKPRTWLPGFLMASWREIDELHRFFLRGIEMKWTQALVLSGQVISTIEVVEEQIQEAQKGDEIELTVARKTKVGGRWVKVDVKITVL